MKLLIVFLLAETIQASQPWQLSCHFPDIRHFFLHFPIASTKTYTESCEEFSLPLPVYMTSTGQSMGREAGSIWDLVASLVVISCRPCSPYH